MKKLFYLMLIVLSTMAFISCSKDGENIITMSTEGTSCKFHLSSDNSNYTIIIDWGDGTKEKFSRETCVLQDNDSIYHHIYAQHTYTDGKYRHIFMINESGVMRNAINIFECPENQITSLYINGCAALNELKCSGNQLTVLDVSKNAALINLDCSYNKLVSLNVSGCVELNYLDCHSNQLNTLSISNNIGLLNLNCGFNKLTSLDVSKNTALSKLWCCSNQLTSLDVSNNTHLTNFNFSNNKLTSLDVSKCLKLNYLDCSDNPLTTLDISKNIALNFLRCYRNPFTTAEINKIFEDLPNVGYDEYAIMGYGECGKPKGIFRWNGNGSCESNNWFIAEQKGWTH